MPHQKYDYLCPINGISDIYEWKTGKRIPDPLLFYLSTIGFSYIRQKKAQVPRMVFWGGGIGKRQYSFLEKIMGFRVHASEGTSFPFALKKAKKYIDEDIPVLLFGLDMYHLPYHDSFYQTLHIPGHVILMVGYSDKEEVIYVHDNSRSEVQVVPYKDLILAWRADYPEGEAKKNTLFAIQYNDQPAEAKEIIHNGLKKRAELALNPPVRFLRISGIRMLSTDFLNWEKELDATQYTEVLKNVVMFTASVIPGLPPKLTEFNTGIPDSHQAARDKFADILVQSRSEYGNISWERAASLFRKSGNLIGQMTEIITEYIIDNRQNMKEIPGLLNQIADYEEEAFIAIKS